MELTKVVSALLRFFQWIAYSPRKELILRSWWLIGESKNRWAKLQLLLPEACSNSKGKAVCTTLFFLITESPEIQVTSGRLRKRKGWCFVRRGSWELSFTFIMLLGGRSRTVRALEKTSKNAHATRFRAAQGATLDWKGSKTSGGLYVKLLCKSLCPPWAGKTKLQFHRKQHLQTDSLRAGRGILKVPDLQLGQGERYSSGPHS